MFDLLIDRDTGSLAIGPDIILHAGDSRRVVTKALTPFVRRERDMGTGYVWLDINDLLFGDQPCAASLCFCNNRLRLVNWFVSLPGAETEGGWPTREAIDNEIAFVRAVIQRQLNADLHFGETIFPWGKIWSRFDPIGFMADNSLLYTP
jgi:hypothetical protein